VPLGSPVGPLPVLPEADPVAAVAAGAGDLQGRGLPEADPVAAVAAVEQVGAEIVS
jgi:hypothetical protein